MGIKCIGKGCDKDAVILNYCKTHFEERYKRINVISAFGASKVSRSPYSARLSRSMLRKMANGDLDNPRLESRISRDIRLR
jgi:hypothetical protein